MKNVYGSKASFGKQAFASAPIFILQKCEKLIVVNKFSFLEAFQHKKKCTKIKIIFMCFEGWLEKSSSMRNWWLNLMLIKCWKGKKLGSEISIWLSGKNLKRLKDEMRKHLMNADPFRT